jgi:hypothetical protein
VPGREVEQGPSRRERCDWVDRTFFDHGRRICRVAQLTPSLRDKVRFVPSGQQTSLTPVHKSDAIPQNPLEDEDDDEDENEMLELVTCREAITPL